MAFRRCGGGCWPMELLWGAMVALLLSVQRHEPLFSLFLLIDTPFSVAALWQRWRGRPTVFLLFPSFFLCNFLSPSLCFFRSLQNISHPLFSLLLLSRSFSLPPFLSFLSVVLPPLFHRLSLAFISQRMPCGETFGLVTACRGMVAMKHSL